MEMENAYVWCAVVHQTALRRYYGISERKPAKRHGKQCPPRVLGFRPAVDNLCGTWVERRRRGLRVKCSKMKVKRLPSNQQQIQEPRCPSKLAAVNGLRLPSVKFLGRHQYISHRSSSCNVIGQHLLVVRTGQLELSRFQESSSSSKWARKRVHVWCFTSEFPSLCQSIAPRSWPHKRTTAGAAVFTRL